MIIQRDNYLNQVISAKGNGLIKIITGIRRCGKSFLLSVLYKRHLLENGVDEDHIIELALDDRINLKYRDPDEILRYINSKIADSKVYYVLLDEVQMIEDFVGVLNSLLHIRNVDVYVTGSNSKFLSKDVITEFRGRGFEIHLYPLSFAEFYSAKKGDKSDCLREYYSFGGLPQLLAIEGYTAKVEYLKNLVSAVYLSDVKERNKVRNEQELDELLKIMASSVGSPCNPTKLSNTFKSAKNISISHNTISRYLSFLCDAFLLEEAIRYNIKGKKYINTLTKYYFTDLGLRNALLNNRQMEESHLMENLIFNELRIRGYSVDVGCVDSLERDKNGKVIRKQYEVDFVANRGNGRLYIQSAFSIPDEAKMRQETASFRKIDDSFKKILIVSQNIMPYRDDNGYLIVGLYDFLLNPGVIETELL